MNETHDIKTPTHQSGWINAAMIITLIIAIITFGLGVMAYMSGMLMSLLIFVLILGLVLAIVLRLPFIILKQINWEFWRSPFAAVNRSAWLHVLSRVAFWSLCAITFYISFIPAQFPKAEAQMLMLFALVPAGILILISLIPKRVGNWPMTAFSIAATVGLGLVVTRALATGFEKREAVTVQTPFAGESFFIHGGHDPLVNYHYAIKSQQHAADIVIPMPDGRMYDGEDMTLDPCYKKPLHAPVDGEVVKVVSNMIDQLKGSSDPQNPAGNHVVIKMDEAHFALLGHMKQNSATVSVGDSVTAGQQIGECGNSGNTTGPHLHFQVQSQPDLFDPSNYTYPVNYKNVTRIRGGKKTSGDGLYFRRNDRMIAKQ